MTSWARLTWQAQDPEALAADLERRLGRGAASHRGLGGDRLLRMRGGDVHLVPWRIEAADDAPRPGGRLVFEPLDPDGDDLAAVDDVASRSVETVLEALALRLAGVGWATVELDRAEAELDPWLEPLPSDGDGQDMHLGARTRIRRSPGLPGEALVLEEPTTEGRLAAALARDGEGPCALYIEPTEGLHAWRAAAAFRGIELSIVRPGPLGPSVLIAGVPSGPHLVVIDRPEGSSPGARSGTIDR